MQATNYFKATSNYPDYVQSEFVTFTQWHSSAPQRQWTFEMDAAAIIATKVTTASETETQFKE